MNLNEITSTVAIDFAIYLRENYSTDNKYGDSLLKEIWLSDATNQELTVEECWNEFVKQYKYGK